MWLVFVWLLSFSKMCLRFIHVVAIWVVDSSFLFIAVNYPHCMPTPHFVYPFIHVSIWVVSTLGQLWIMNYSTLGQLWIMQLWMFPYKSAGSFNNAGFFFLTTVRQAFLGELLWTLLCLRIMDRVMKLMCYSWEAKIVIEGVRRS